jgi:uncharacterized protein YqjF (DUF2071 family)
MEFLKARWEHLIMANYLVDPKILHPFLPLGTELDLHEGNCYVSVVGFMFKNTKVRGIGLPFHQDFEEVNLRFYVKRKKDNIVKRGAVFIKEIVPKKLISLVANTLYHEHYFTTKMNHSIKTVNNVLKVHYGWENNNKKQFIEVTSELKNNPIMIGSTEEFIAEHYWGYTKISDKKTSSYEVKHPSWNQHKIINYNINIDFEENYGESFEILNNSKPHSVFLLDGSNISVGNKQVIK